MITITLKELNQVATRLPHPQTAADMRRFTYQVPIPELVKVAPLTTEPTVSRMVRIATFELRQYVTQGAAFWRWTPLDEIVI
jgi:hypothetical protein